MSGNQCVVMQYKGVNVRVTDPKICSSCGPECTRENPECFNWDPDSNCDGCGMIISVNETLTIGASEDWVIEHFCYECSVKDFVEQEIKRRRKDPKRTTPKTQREKTDEKVKDNKDRRQQELKERREKSK